MSCQGCGGPDWGLSPQKMDVATLRGVGMVHSPNASLWASPKFTLPLFAPWGARASKNNSHLFTKKGRIDRALSKMPEVHLKSSLLFYPLSPISSWRQLKQMKPTKPSAFGKIQSFLTAPLVCYLVFLKLQLLPIPPPSHAHTLCQIFANLLQ